MVYEPTESDALIFKQTTEKNIDIDQIQEKIADM